MTPRQRVSEPITGATAKDNRSLGTVLFIFGMVLVTFLALITIWPDLEASLFDAAISGEERLGNVSCPMLITANETAAIKATFRNRSDRAVQFLTYARISEGRVSLMRQANVLVQLEPGETREYRWPISASDAAYGRVVLARVHRLRGAGERASQKACGILVLNIPFLRGSQVIAGTLVIALLSIAGGATLWWRRAKPLPGAPQRHIRTVGAICGLLLLAMVLGMLGIWLVGLLTLVVVVLLLVSAVDRSVASR